MSKYINKEALSDQIKEVCAKSGALLIPWVIKLLGTPAEMPVSLPTDPFSWVDVSAKTQPLAIKNGAQIV